MYGVPCPGSRLDGGGSRLSSPELTRAGLVPVARCCSMLDTFKVDMRASMPSSLAFMWEYAAEVAAAVADDAAAAAAASVVPAPAERRDDVAPCDAEPLALVADAPVPLLDLSSRGAIGIEFNEAPLVARVPSGVEFISYLTHGGGLISSRRNAHKATKSLNTTRGESAASCLMLLFLFDFTG